MASKWIKQSFYYSTKPNFFTVKYGEYILTYRAYFIDIFMPKRTKVALFSGPVSAGFPSPADDFLEKNLDLNTYLIKHPAATFLVRVQGESMINSHIRSGDILIVDRSIENANNKIVVALINGEFTVKRIKKMGNKLWLMPENPRYRPIVITSEMNFEIWGVVTHVIHSTSHESN